MRFNPSHNLLQLNENWIDVGTALWLAHDAMAKIAGKNSVLLICWSTRCGYAALFIYVTKWKMIRIRSFRCQPKRVKNCERNAKLRIKYFPWIAIGSLRISISSNLSETEVISFGAKETMPSMMLRYIRCTTSASYTWRAQGVVLCSLCSFIYFIEESRYIYRHKSEPTPPTTTKKTTMMIKTHDYSNTRIHIHTHTRGDSSTSRNEQLIKFQLKKAEFCAKNKNEKKSNLTDSQPPLSISHDAKYLHRFATVANLVQSHWLD